jgi:hypothetical protein
LRNAECAQSGVSNVGATEEDEEEDLADIRVVAKPAEVGEGARRPSWIWFQSISGHDDMSDPLMRAGKPIVDLPADLTIPHC